jgi:hypothetical protein
MKTTITRAKVLPCPFCGEEPYVGQHSVWHVSCINPKCICPMSVGNGSMEADIETWNRRAPAKNVGPLIKPYLDAKAIMFDAGCECLSPDQGEEFEALFGGDAGTWDRLLRCIVKRLLNGRETSDGS